MKRILTRGVQPTRHFHIYARPSICQLGIEFSIGVRQRRREVLAADDDLRENGLRLAAKVLRVRQRGSKVREPQLLRTSGCRQRGRFPKRHVFVLDGLSAVGRIAVGRFGNQQVHIAEELDGLALSMTTAIAEIEAEGDRIDRLQADNRAMLDDLLNGS